MARVVESDTVPGGSDVQQLSLDSIRESLIRQEDTIVFSLIERAKFPLNSPAFEDSSSLTEFFVREIETIQAKVGRYENPEENPFFLDTIPHSVFPTHKYPQVLHPKASSVNINKRLWDVYFKELLPLFVKPGDDSNYASTAASDLACLHVGTSYLDSQIQAYVLFMPDSLLRSCLRLFREGFTMVSLLLRSNSEMLLMTMSLLFALRIQRH